MKNKNKKEEIDSVPGDPEEELEVGSELEDSGEDEPEKKELEEDWDTDY